MPHINSIAVSVNRLLTFEAETRKLDVSREIESRAIEALNSHPHFRGRGSGVRCRCSKRRLILTGRVPSYYLKQLAQEAVRDVQDIDLIDNRIVVAGSGCPSKKPVEDIDKTSASHRASP